MAREVKIRISYQQDAQYLTKFARAVELDPRRTKEWKAKAIQAANALTMLLFEASNQENMVEATPTTKGKRRAG